MNLIFCSFLSHVRVAAIYYLLDLFQITDLLRIVLLNMSLTECASKAARLHSYLRERGRLKIGVSLFKIVSPQEFSSRKKLSLWNPVLRESWSGSTWHWEKAAKKARDEGRSEVSVIITTLNNIRIKSMPEALRVWTLVGSCRV